VTREPSPRVAGAATARETPRTGAAAIGAVAALVRWPNALLAAAGVALGAQWAIVIDRCRVPTLAAGVGWRVGFAAASALALTAAANAYNDVDDHAIDVVAHPERPIPTGAVSVRLARRVGGTASVLAVALSAAAATGLGLLSLAVIGVVRRYGALKARAGLIANAAVAIVGALPFVYGAWAVGRPLAALPLVALAAPLQLARELAKDLDDLPGARGRRRTLPVVAGATPARAGVAVATLATLLALAPLVASWSPGSPRAWAGASLVPGVAAAVAGMTCAVIGRRGAAALFKRAMVLAIVAVAVMLVALPPRCA
jgi:geranylgeranylglycerol-phosphate geranylgeranyltransferase